MKERPILFNTEMVKAILEGRKTQTRRVIKPQTSKNLSKSFSSDDVTQAWKSGFIDVKCPYGTPLDTEFQTGSLLWVKETFFNDSGWGEPDIYYRADGEFREQFKDIASYRYKDLKWKPSIHMFKKDARIWLKIKNIRVERVQCLSVGDAIAEGILSDYSEQCKFAGKMLNDFKVLWDSLNKKRGYGWDKNPYVWVVEFERIEK